MIYFSRFFSPQNGDTPLDKAERFNKTETAALLKVRFPFIDIFYYILHDFKECFGNLRILAICLVFNNFISPLQSLGAKKGAEL